VGSPIVLKWSPERGRDPAIRIVHSADKEVERMIEKRIESEMKKK